MSQASGLEKTSASNILMDHEDLGLEVGELLQDGRESSGRIIWLLIPETLVVLGAVCPSLGAAVPIEIRGGLWLQKFLQMKKWAFYVGGWEKDEGRKACKGVICLLGYRAFQDMAPTAGGWDQKGQWWDLKEVFPYSCWMMCPVSPLKMVLHVLHCSSWLKGSSAF